MTQAFVGVPLLAPPLLPPLVSFVGSALPADPGELEAMAKYNPGGQDPWALGGSFRTIAGSGGISVAAICGSGWPVPGTSSGLVAVNGIGIEAEDTCSALGFAGDYWARARQKHDAWLSYAIAHEFWTGTLSTTANPVLGNFYLASAAAGGANDITPASATKSGDALARLDEALGKCLKGARGMIHCSIRMLDDLATNNGLRWKGDDPYTWAWTPLVADAGYTGSAPDGSSDASGATEYLYATGLVKLYRSKEPTLLPGQDQIAQAMLRPTNDITVRAISSALVVVDPTCLLSIKALATPPG